MLQQVFPLNNLNVEVGKLTKIFLLNLRAAK